jgi:putative flippase GtrA
MTARALVFAVVGFAGFLIQLAVTITLLERYHWPLAAALAAGVEAAVLANFAAHERWTWNDRRYGGSGRLSRLGRFHLSNGVASIVGNVVIGGALLQMKLAPWLASSVAVLVMSLWNFLAADRWVFLKRAAVVALGFAMLNGRPAAAAELTPAALAAWNAHVARVEATPVNVRSRAPLAEPEGRSIGVDGGMIHEWRGSVIVPNITVSELIDILEDPESLPPQEDVAVTRLLSRHGDALRVDFKLVRRFIVSVTYDSEHEVTYQRCSPSLATSRSVATKIAEADGGDRGFLWRLNSYWTYRQVGRDVQVDVLSLSLSRDVPMLVKPVAGPIMERIGRESMLHTLEMVRSAPSAAQTRRSTAH